jgi:hypothetical protein
VQHRLLVLKIPTHRRDRDFAKVFFLFDLNPLFVSSRDFGPSLSLNANCRTLNAPRDTDRHVFTSRKVVSVRLIFLCTVIIAFSHVTHVVGRNWALRNSTYDDAPYRNRFLSLHCFYCDSFLFFFVLFRSRVVNSLRIDHFFPRRWSCQITI